MSEKVKQPTFKEMQAWRATVKYNKDGDALQLGATFLCEKMDTVFRYMQRKFARIAASTTSIVVEDLGILSSELRLELVEEDDGGISAYNSAGEKVFSEGINSYSCYRPPPTQSALPVVMNHQPPVYKPYVPTPPLTAYDVFEKVSFPLNLHTYGGDPSRFRAKFYEVFPKEK